MLFFEDVVNFCYDKIETIRTSTLKTMFNLMIEDDEYTSSVHADLLALVTYATEEDEAGGTERFEAIKFDVATLMGTLIVRILGISPTDTQGFIDVLFDETLDNVNTWAWVDFFGELG